MSNDMITDWFTFISLFFVMYFTLASGLEVLINWMVPDYNKKNEKKMKKRLDLYSILCVHLGINNE